MFFKSKPECSKGPDFICIGMQKAGTAYLYNCLNSLDSFRLPVLKEIHHFDYASGYGNPRSKIRMLRGVARQLGASPRKPGQLKRYYRNLDLDTWLGLHAIELSNRTVPADETTLEFLKKLSVYVAGKGKDRDYLNLFAPYRDFITGDITPGYSTLDSAAVGKVRALLPETKIILCVRDPVSRLWSQLNMHARGILKRKLGRQPGPADAGLMEEILSSAALADILAQKKFSGRSFATLTHARWLEHFPKENMLVISFDDLTERTGQVIDKICSMFDVSLGAQSEYPANRKENKLKVELDSARRGVVEEFLGDETERFLETFS